MDNDSFISFLEWESFNWDENIFNIDCKSKYYYIQPTSKIAIHRNEEYKLVGLLSDSTNSYDYYNQLERKHSAPGEILLGDTIKGTDEQKKSSYTLYNFFIKNTNFNYSVQEMQNNVSAEIGITKIEEIISCEETDFMYEFYLTSNIHLNFPRGTYRCTKEDYRKIRVSIDDIINEDDLILQIPNSYTNDYFYIQLSEFNFIVQKVNCKFLPEWGNGLLIEYRSSFKSIPSKEIREAVAEIIGFVLGSQMIKIGETHFNSKKNIIRRIAVSPWEDNILLISKNSAQPPIDFRNIFDYYKVEKVLNEVTQKYLINRTNLKLDEFMSRYWIALRMPIGLNLPILAIALECLADAYLESNVLPNSITVEEKESYKILIDNVVKDLSQKLKSYTFKDRVLNSLQNPFDLSIGQKIKLFLESISIFLPKQSIENQALRSRNKMTHTSINTNDEEMIKLIKLSYAYKSLVNRVILIILDFTGGYIDYFTIGYPERDINENIPI